MPQSLLPIPYRASRLNFNLHFELIKTLNIARQVLEVHGPTVLHFSSDCRAISEIVLILAAWCDGS
jgi:hypothetical protein